jgi:uncharacterized 2Fe-2S/4Fe-4S cluster protein (DUF4445 family)
VPVSPAGEKLLDDKEKARGIRLACQTKIASDMTMNIPVETRFFEHKTLVDGTFREVKLHPNIKKIFVRLPKPTLADQRSDLDRLLAAINGHIPNVRAEMDVIRMVPDLIRKDDFAVTAVLESDEIVNLELGDTTKQNYGMAFDIGTTTVVGILVDLNTGKQLAVASRTNPQVVFGDDVVSRITYATERPSGLRELQHKIIGCMNEIIARVTHKAGVDRNNIYEVTFGGNTTMHHLLLSINPAHIAQTPYVAVVREAINTKASRLGININPNGNVFAMPNIAGFVGGDTVGVILAADMMQSEKTILAIDIGTNGELALGTKDRMICCSCAAGPAFEGARIRFGMRASDGAIEKVLMRDDVELNVIGNVRARGICGTGLIDAVAELLRLGVIDSTGKLLGPSAVPEAVPPAVRKRIVSGQNGLDFILVPGDASQNGQPILLTQRDVREVQLAKGAIFAGIQILKRELGIGDSDIHEILLAGAFGNFIRRNQAKRIGLLPDLPTDRIRFIGNAAGAGARMALVARECRREATRISEQVRYVELGGRPDFQEEFMTAMMFPEELKH